MKEKTIEKCFDDCLVEVKDLEKNEIRNLRKEAIFDSFHIFQKDRINKVMSQNHQLQQETSKEVDFSV